ncbi:MAG TPA: hypothetical protein VII75_06600 [Thermoanaerobaculia bacterium]|nr:hypothetical protein [Thermoanaerobaculia bacterium]
MKALRSLALVLLGVSTIAVSPAGETPHILRAADPQTSYPIWVAFDAALTEGKLNAQLIAPQARARLEHLLATRAEQAKRAASQGVSSGMSDICFGEPPAEIGLPDSNLPSLVRSSMAIFEGRIEEVLPGFYRGTPASLLAVRVDAMPRASSSYATTVGGRIYVYYPSAVIRAEGVVVCTRPATHEARPNAGDRLLVFALQPPEDSGHVFVYPQASRHLIFETAGGVLQLPQQLKRSLAGFNDLDSLMTRVDYELDAQRGGLTPSEKRQ